MHAVATWKASQAYGRIWSTIAMRARLACVAVAYADGLTSSRFHCSTGRDLGGMAPRWLSHTAVEYTLRG